MLIETKLSLDDFEMHGVNGVAKEKTKKRQMHVDSSQVLRLSASRQLLSQVEEALNPNIRAVKETSRMNALRKTARQKCFDGHSHCAQNDHQDEHRVVERRRCVPTAKTISEEDAKNNHVLRNILEVGAKKEASAPIASSSLWTEKEGYGQVPHYLQMRKLQLAQERDARQRAKQSSICPPGMRIMDGEEQREALEKILKNKDAVRAQLQHLPLVVETPSLTKLKTESDGAVTTTLNQLL